MRIHITSTFVNVESMYVNVTTTFICIAMTAMDLATTFIDMKRNDRGRCADVGHHREDVHGHCEDLRAGFFEQSPPRLQS
jgi:hypothetical protein